MITQVEIVTFTILLMMLALVIVIVSRKAKRHQAQTGANPERVYILWVTTEHPEGGYSSRWHGWSQNKFYTYEEALAEQAKITNIFFTVAILQVIPVSKKKAHYPKSLKAPEGENTNDG